ACPPEPSFPERSFPEPSFPEPSSQGASSPELSRRHPLQPSLKVCSAEAPRPIPRVQQQARNSAQPLTTALPGGDRPVLVCSPATRPIASHRTRARAALLSVPEYLGECSQPRAPPASLQSS